MKFLIDFNHHAVRRPSWIHFKFYFKLFVWSLIWLNSVNNVVENSLLTKGILEFWNSDSVGVEHILTYLWKAKIIFFSIIWVVLWSYHQIFCSLRYRIRYSRCENDSSGGPTRLHLYLLKNVRELKVATNARGETHSAGKNSSSPFPWE